MVCLANVPCEQHWAGKEMTESWQLRTVGHLWTTLGHVALDLHVEGWQLAAQLPGGWRLAETEAEGCACQQGGKCSNLLHAALAW